MGSRISEKTTPTISSNWLTKVDGQKSNLLKANYEVCTLWRLTT